MKLVLSSLTVIALGVTGASAARQAPEITAGDRAGLCLPEAAPEQPGDLSAKDPCVFGRSQTSDAIEPARRLSRAARLQRIAETKSPCRGADFADRNSPCWSPPPSAATAPGRFTEADIDWQPAMEPYRAEILATVNTIAQEECPTLDPRWMGLASDISGEQIFYVTCGKLPAQYNIFFRPDGTRALLELTASQRRTAEQLAGRPNCRDYLDLTERENGYGRIGSFVVGRLVYAACVMLRDSR